MIKPNKNPLIMNAITVRWYDYDQRIIIFEFDGHFGMVDLFAAIDECLDLAAAHPEQRDTISVFVDARNVPRIPVGNVARYREILRKFEGVVPYIAIIGSNTLIRMLVDTFRTLTRGYLKIRSVEDFETAEVVIRDWLADSSA